ncbi:MAG: endonuclease [Rhodocyclaceae bacterium]|jgi:restriction system protein|nr:MAG: endonuclease [Rhodocyclaceae bacterium]TND04200.1 MAG: endonuclease [Rhodocyclaceae bacterium]
MARKKQSTAEDLFDLVAMLPWWAGVALAVVAYVWLHQIAVAPTPTLGTTAQMGSFVAGQFGKTLAMFGQYLLPFICLFGAAASAYGRARRGRLLADVTQNLAAGALDGMTWNEFELLVGEAFRHRGYAVTETGGGGADGGVDLELGKGGERFLVQCKQWKAFKVGVSTVRELYGVMAARGAAGGFVVTSGQFTADAEEFAAGRNITLIDGPVLRTLIGGVQSIPAAKQSGGPACPQCGSGMVRRTAKRGTNAGGSFWGCSKYPACRGVRDI